MKKEILPTIREQRVGTEPPWLDLDSIALVRLTSEDARHPIEAALRSNPSQGWRAAQPGEQTIWISFNAPQPIQEIDLGFEIADPLTQEFVLSWSANGGLSYRELVRQQFNFSPASIREDEAYVVNLAAVTDLKLAIKPDISNGHAHATLRYLHLR